jgi:hypothetical protein
LKIQGWAVVVVVMVGFQTLPGRTKPCNPVFAKMQKKRGKDSSQKAIFNQYNTDDKTLMKISPSPDDEEDDKNFSNPSAEHQIYITRCWRILWRSEDVEMGFVVWAISQTPEWILFFWLAEW